MKKQKFWLPILFLCLCFSLTIEAQDTLDQVEEVETIQVVQVVDTNQIEQMPDTPMGPVKIAGRMHPAMVHMPIGFLLALLLLETLTFSKWGTGLEKASLIVGGATVLSFFPALISGMIRASELFANAPASELLNSHRNLMIAAAVLVIAAFALRIAKKNQLQGKVKILHLGLLGVATIAISIGGHLGGKMVFGEGFLPF